MNAQTLIGFVLLSLASGTALAQQGTPLPEPGVLELLGVGAVAAVAVAVRKRRK